ncbi:MAG: hypothetical protein IJC39_03640 [Firmicutes bacterium]|nr:hypothetical protein [Bacillota bacterium]
MKNKLKALVSVILAAAVLVACASCGKNGESNTSTNDGADFPYTSAESLLSKVWKSYGEEEKFHAIGGDESHMNEEGPGKYSIEDAEVLDSVLGFPSAEISKIDDAASLMHAMNQNTFTCAAFRFKNEKDIEGGIAALKRNILSRRWICGFPDSLVIAKAPGNYVIAVWGIDEGNGTVSLFKQKLKSAVDGVQIAVDEEIV